jgi:hypothetical protein
MEGNKENTVYAGYDPSNKHVEINMESLIELIRSWIKMGLTNKQIAYNTNKYINSFYIKKSSLVKLIENSVTN